MKRPGENLYTTVDQDLYKAVPRGEITMDTISGKVKQKVRLRLYEVYD